MKTIAIETSSLTGSVALLDGGKVLDEVRFTEGLFHGREIMLRIREMVDSAGMALRDIGLVAVSRGPGSYTGLRVGITTAKTLAWTLGAALVGPATPDIIAENAGSDCGNVAVALDAKRGEIYAARYESPTRQSRYGDGARKGDNLNRIGELEVLKPKAFADMLADGTCLLGDTAELYANIWSGLNVKLAGPDESVPRASVVGRLGLKLYEKGKAEQSPHEMVPIYLRLSEAEEKRINNS